MDQYAESVCAVCQLNGLVLTPFLHLQTQFNTECIHAYMHTYIHIVSVFVSSDIEENGHSVYEIRALHVQVRFEVAQSVTDD